jgi:hypothetical protein
MARAREALGLMVMVVVVVKKDILDVYVVVSERVDMSICWTVLRREALNELRVVLGRVLVGLVGR